MTWPWMTYFVGLDGSETFEDLTDLIFPRIFGRRHGVLGTLHKWRMRTRITLKLAFNDFLLIRALSTVA